jgi:hypothetical protein
VTYRRNSSASVPLLLAALALSGCQSPPRAPDPPPVVVAPVRLPDQARVPPPTAEEWEAMGRAAIERLTSSWMSPGSGP